MRKTRTLILIIAALALASCTGLRQAQKTSKTNPVEVNYGVTDNYSLPQTFWSDFTVSVPKEYRNPNTGILVVPRLQNRNGSKFMNMPACVAEGRLHKKFNDRQTIFDPSLLDSATVRKFYLKEGDTKIQFTDTVLLEPWMRNSRLLVDVYADAYGRRVLLSSNEIPVSIVDVNSFANPEPMEKYYHTLSHIRGRQPEERSWLPLLAGFIFIQRRRLRTQGKGFDRQRPFRRECNGLWHKRHRLGISGRIFRA
jgi:hypothetical protein